MPHRREPRRAWRPELAWAAGAALFTCVLAALALHLWDASLRVPLDYSGDGIYNQVVVKGVLENGWYQHNPYLGAPFGQTLYDFPVVSGDNLQILLIKALGLFSSDSAVVMNLFFLVTFPLTALTAYGAARLLGLARPAAAVLATLFALLPYHFIRGEYHLFIGAYYAVPLGAYLAISAMAGSGIFAWRAPRGLRAGLNEHPGRVLAIALACLVIGSAHVYYAAFTIALLVIAAGVRLVAGSPRVAVTALVLATTIGAVVSLNHLPNTLYRADHGPNQTLKRPAAESETYGLKIAAMALPVPDHRLAPLARLRARYDDASTQLHEGPPQALGLLATAGLAGLVLVALAALADARRRLPIGPLVLPLAATTLAAIVLGTVGGLSSLFAYVASPQLRAWGRISIFVGFFGLLAVVLAAESLRARRGARAGVAAFAVLLVLGFLDQTNGGSVPSYAQTRASYRSDAAFVAGIEHTLGRGASVFQLPYEPFPEPQPAWEPPAGPYDMARGYVHSHGLRWSWGMMKGRAGDWQNALVKLPPELVSRALAAAGFRGVYVDRAAYSDGGAGVLSRLQREIGVAAAHSSDGRLVFFDLRGYARRLLTGHSGQARALRSAVLRPVTLQFGPGFSSARMDAHSRYFLAERDAGLIIVNFGEKARRVTAAMTLASPYQSPRTVEVHWPDTVQRLRATVEGTPVKRSLVIPPGVSIVSLHTNGEAQLAMPQSSQPYYLRVIDPLVTDDAFKPFGPPPRDETPASFLSPFGAT